MACQHSELYLRLDDAEQLRRYAQFVVSKHNTLDDALGKARAKSRYWEQKAKECMERATVVENERNEAKEEVVVARAAPITTRDVKARVDKDLARAQDSHPTIEEAKRKAEAETACLKVDRTSLLMDIGATKDEVSALQSQARKDKEALEGEY